MNYTVIYRPSAEAHLIDLWTESPDRNDIARAADEIDSMLGDDPHECGESRTADHRIVFVHPLAALFRIDEEDKQVIVLRIWRVK